MTHSAPICIDSYTVMLGMLEDFAVDVLSRVVTQVSPRLRDLLVKAVEELEAAAEGTDNAYDDILVEVLKDVLKVSDQESAPSGSDA